MVIGSQSGANSGGPAPRALPKIIAIDGPAGAGKTTVAEALAKQLGYLYFDTGILYRTVTLAALRHNLTLDDQAALATLVDEIVIAITAATVNDGRHLTVLLDGEDVTWAIRTPEVNQNVSIVSAQKVVRESLLQRQRAIAAQGGVIMAGRDIGTVVLPNADLKIYLDASPKERAIRRAAEEQARGIQRPFEAVQEEIDQRDELDSHRAVSPLRQAEDAVVVNTDGLPIDQVLAKINAVISEQA